jgi:hypothetical protein
MDDDNIIPYETSPSLTAKQAVMYILGYRGEYYYVIGTDEFEFDLSDYLRDLQEDADCAFGNASSELKVLKRTDSPSPEAIKNAEQRVESTKAKLEKVQKLPDVAEDYRLLINHEISRVRSGKHSPLVIDEDESTRTGQLCFTTTSFLDWLGEMDLDDATGNYEPIPLPVGEDDFARAIEGKSAASLHLTLGLLVSLFAESSGNTFGTRMKPNISRIAREIHKHSTILNDDFPLEGQGIERIKDRIETGKRALELYVWGEDLAKKYH